MCLFHATKSELIVGDRMTDPWPTNYYIDVVSALESARPVGAPSRREAFFAAESQEFAVFFLMAQNVLLAAESQGLGGVFIGGIRNDPQVVVEQLALPHRVVPVFGMCLGWPDEDNPVKPRMPVDLVLHQDSYRDPPPQRVAQYDAQMAVYYAGRGSNVKLSDWSTAVAGAMQGKKREHMLAFLRERGFFLR